MTLASLRALMGEFLERVAGTAYPCCADSDRPREDCTFSGGVVKCLRCAARALLLALPAPGATGEAGSEGALPEYLHDALGAYEEAARTAGGSGPGRDGANRAVSRASRAVDAAILRYGSDRAALQPRACAPGMGG